MCSDRPDKLKSESSPERSGTVENISPIPEPDEVDKTPMTTRVRKSFKGLQPGRFQFGLSGLFWLTTLVAVACATLRATGLHLLDVVGFLLLPVWMFGPLVVYAVADLLPRSKGRHRLWTHILIAVAVLLPILGTLVMIAVTDAGAIWFGPLVVGMTCFWVPQIILLWALLRWSPINARRHAEEVRLPNSDILRNEPHEDDGEIPAEN